MTAPEITPAELYAEAEDAQRLADELRREAEQIEDKATTSAAELRTEADGIEVSVWPRLLLLTKARDPEQVARVESVAVEAGAVVAGRRDASVFVDRNGERVTDSGLPIEGLPGVSLVPVYEITVAAPADHTLTDVAARAATYGLTWPR